MRIARLWESTLGLDAMRLNERGDFAGATGLFRDTYDELGSFAAGMSVEGLIQHNLNVAECKVSRPWDGRSKRESMTSAKKFSKGERDYRSDPRVTGAITCRGDRSDEAQGKDGCSSVG